MTLLLIILLVIVLSGTGYGWNRGYVSYGNPIGLIIIILLVLILLGAIGVPYYWR